MAKRLTPRRVLAGMIAVLIAIPVIGLVAMEAAMRSFELQEETRAPILRLRVSRDGDVTTEEPGGEVELASSAVLFVHGSMYDPFADGAYSPFTTTYPVWSRIFPEHQSVDLGWYSYPTTIRGLLTAWRDGHAGWFSAAFAASNQVARAAGPALAAYPVQIEAVVCHSFGCRVAVDLIEQGQIAPRRMIAFSGAVSNERVRRLVQRSQISILNVTTPRDRVAQAYGLGADALANSRTDYSPGPGSITTLVVEPHRDAVTAATGNNPHRFFNHVLAYEWTDVWPRYRAFLSTGSACAEENL